MMVLVLLLYLPGVGSHDAPSNVIRGGFDVYGDGDLCGPSWLAVSVGGGLSWRWALALIGNAAAVLDGIGGGALLLFVALGIGGRQWCNSCVGDTALGIRTALLLLLAVQLLAKKLSWRCDQNHNVAVRKSENE